MRRTINLFILAIAFCATLSTSAQTVNSSKLDSLLLALDKANKAMGSVAIAQNGNVVYARLLATANFPMPETLLLHLKQGSYRIHK